MSDLLQITDSNFEQEVTNSDIPVLVDFWAPWCAPCRMVGPVVEELSSDYTGKIKVGKVNTDENQSRAGELGIRGIPTIILFKDGKEAERVVGAVPKAALQQMIDKNIG